MSENTEAALKRVTSKDGGLRFSQLTDDERQALLKIYDENSNLFDIYVEFRKRMDEFIKDALMNGTDVLQNNDEANKLLAIGLGPYDLDKVGAAAANVHMSATAHLRTLARESARRLLGSNAHGADGIIEALLRMNGVQ